jgi:hypothetical protein
MTEPENDLTFDIQLSERQEGSISLRPIGMRAYVLIEVVDVTDHGLELAVEVGGGAKARPVEELAEFIAIVGEALGEYTEATDDEDADTDGEE